MTHIEGGGPITLVELFSQTTVKFKVNQKIFMVVSICMDVFILSLFDFYFFFLFGISGSSTIGVNHKSKLFFFILNFYNFSPLVKFLYII